MKKKSKVINVTEIVLLAIVFSLILAVLIWSYANKIKNGWTNNDTVQTIFEVLIIILGPAISYSFIRYFVTNNKEIIIINNSLYKLFLLNEENKKIEYYERQLLLIQKQKVLSEMNSILSKQIKNVTLTEQNLHIYFDVKSGIYIGSEPISFRSESRLFGKYQKYKNNKSIKYEKLYQSIHSGELLKKAKFPLLETILPFVLGAFGAFATVYQTLSINGEINESLLTYFGFFGMIILYGLIVSVYCTDSFKRFEIQEKNKIICDLEKLGG